MKKVSLITIVLLSFVLMSCTGDTQQNVDVNASAGIDGKETVNLIILDTLEEDNYPLVSKLIYINDTVVLEVRKEQSFFDGRRIKVKEDK